MVALPSAPPPPAKKPVFQSASRNETFLTCSQLYAAKYLAKLPDAGNDGSRRGDAVHKVLELLAKPRHRPLVEEILRNDTCTQTPAVWKLLSRYGRENGVGDPKNLDIMDGFTVVALENEFYGPPGTIEDTAELEFSLQVNEPDGRRFNTRGFIDRLFKVRDEQGLRLEARDFKTSKERPKGEKLTWNTQSMMYQTVLRRLFPDIPRRRLRFLYAKFRKDPWVEEEPLTDEQLKGYEVNLTGFQEALESFTEANAGDNLAAYDQDKQWLCGREGVKKDGSPCWICTARRPMDYHVIVDADGAIVTSGFTAEALRAKVDAAKGQRIEQRHWKGCIAFQRRRGLS